MNYFFPKIPDSVAKAIAEADKIQRCIPREVLELDKTLQSIPSKAFEMDALTRSQISPALLEFENAMSKQFNSLPSLKIMELKDEYENELLPAVDLINNTDIESATDEELVSICEKTEKHIINFAQSASEKIKVATDEILIALTSPKTNPQRCIQILFQILMAVVSAYLSKLIY